MPRAQLGPVTAPSTPAVGPATSGCAARNRGLAASLLAAGLTAALLTACNPAGQAQPPRRAGTAVEVDDLDLATTPHREYAAAPPLEAAARPQPPAPIPGLRRGAVARAAVDAVLDRGPGVFLRDVEIAPHFRNHRFAGWEIRRIAADRFLARVDLRPGDVVASINGHLIVKPRNLSALWQQLRSAEVIVVRVNRAEQSFELRFDIVDKPNPSGP